MDPLPTQAYLEQVARWPSTGRHILAHADESSVIVYQAFRPSIAHYALTHGVFGGPDFSFSRMSWFKPNFLWMMYRSAWATADGQQVVLAIRLSRSFFEHVLSSAVASSHDLAAGESRAEWQAQLHSSDVRLQWDPDHGPAAEKLERRAIQLGLRGATLRAYATGEIREIIDMTPLVTEQRAHIKDWARLRTPVEDVYRVSDPTLAQRIRLDTA